MFYQPYATNNCDSTAWEHLESRGHSRRILVFLMEREKCHMLNLGILSLKEAELKGNLMLHLKNVPIILRIQTS